MENEFYRRVRAGEYPEFTPVVPASYTADQVRGMLGGELSAAQRAGLDDRNCVYLQNLTSDPDQAKILDTKIGRSTTSYRENRAQQDKSAWDAGLPRGRRWPPLPGRHSPPRRLRPPSPRRRRTSRARARR